MAEASSLTSELNRSRLSIESGTKHKKVSELVDNKLSPFHNKTMKEVFLYAMGIGLRNGKRIPLKKKTQAIPLTSFTPSDIALIEAIAISEKGTVDMLFADKAKEILDIAEEYANAGIDILHYQIFGEEPGDPDRKIEQVVRDILDEDQRAAPSASKSPGERLKSFEGELRDFIETSLAERVGKDWWKKTVPQDVQENCVERKQKRAGVPWMDEGDHPLICYADFNDYFKIITKRDNWKNVFAAVFSDEAWVKTKLLLELGPIRNDIAHNRELDPRSVQKLELSTQEVLQCIRKARKSGTDER